MGLTLEEVSAFHVRGHVTIAQLVDDDEIVWLAQVIDRLLERRAGWEQGRALDLAGTDEAGAQMRLPQLLAPQHDAPELLDASFLPMAEQIGRDLLGPSATTSIAMAIVKPAGTGAETPWHQDAAYWDPDVVHSAASIWIPLQDANEENGCLQFVPGSHRLDVFEHQHLGGDPRVHALELPNDIRAAAVRSPVLAPVEAGGASIHHGYTLHRAGPNTTGGVRRALILSVRNPSEDVPRVTRRAMPWQDDAQTAVADRARAARS